jgi:hypothetical protein
MRPVVFALAAFALLTASAAASPGNVDATFGAGGLATAQLTASPSSASATSMVVTPGGGATVAGYVNTATPGRLVRFTATGVLDSSFGGGDGIVDVDAKLFHLARQSDGAVVAHTNAGALRRFTSSGLADQDFPTNATLPGPVVDLAVAGDDAVYVAGAGWIARLTPTGSVDSGFGTGGVATLPGAIQALAIALLPQLSGMPQLLVGGRSGQAAALLRLGAGGSPDPTFHGGAPRVWSYNMLGCAEIDDVAVGAAGAIVLAGGYSYSGPDYLDSFVAGTSADGVLTFGQLAETPIITCASNGRKGTAPPIAVQADGRILEVLNDDEGDFVDRLKPDGSRDQYASSGFRSTSPAAVGTDAAGRGYVAGSMIISAADPARGVAVERFRGGDNQPPSVTVTFDPPTLYRGQTFKTTANASDPDGTVRYVEFDFNGDGILDEARYSAPWTSSPQGYATLGLHAVGVRAYDDLGAMAKTVAYVELKKTPSPPVAAIRLGFASPGPAKRPLTFESRSFDHDGTITLAWDFDGDGYDDGTTTPITYTYATTGSKTVRLKVTDDDGYVAEMSANFELYDPDAMPLPGCVTCTVTPASPAAKPRNLKLSVRPRVLRGAATVRLTCSEPPACSGHVVIARRGSRNLSGASRYGTALYRVAPGAAKSVNVKLSPRARRLLRRSGRVLAKLVAFDADGRPVATLNTVTLRRG